MNKVAIIMAQWNRQFNFKRTIDDLNTQTYKKFDLFLWNNDPKQSHFLENGVKNARGYKVHIVNSEENKFGFGRFLMARLLVNDKIDGFKGECYESIIFFDDDQILSPEFVEDMVNHFEKKSYKGGYAFRIKNDNYRSRVRSGDGGDADYIGTCGAIIDPEIFKNDDFFDTYLPDEDVYWLEDIALTLYCKKIGWKTLGTPRRYVGKMFPKGRGRRGQFNIRGGFPPKVKGYKKLKTHYLG